MARTRKAGCGHVVLVGSMSADLREEKGSVYAATGAAIQAFAESLGRTVGTDVVSLQLRPHRQVI